MIITVVLKVLHEKRLEKLFRIEIFLLKKLIELKKLEYSSLNAGIRTVKT